MRLDRHNASLSAAIATARLSRRAALAGAGSGMLGLAGLAGGLAPRLTLAQSASPAASEIAAYPETVFRAKDFEFVDLPATIAGGWVRLTMHNEGPMDHHAMVLKLNEGVTAEQIDALAGQPDAFQFLQLSTAIGGPGSIGAGETGSVILELTPGEYRVICVIPDEEDNGTPHYMKGMLSSLTVTDPAAELAAPAGATQQIALIEFAFDDFAPQQAAGEQLWQVANVGHEIHELVIYRQAPGVTYEMVEGMFGITGAGAAASPAAGESAMATPGMSEEMMAGTPAGGMMGTPEGGMAGPPFVAVAGVAPMLPGNTNWAVVDLAPGGYFAICFLPSPEYDFAPHFALGMIAPFTVS